MGVLIWLIVTVVLAGLELLAGEFTLLMLAGGAAAAAGVALFDVPLWAEVLTFAVSSVGLLVFLRPALRRRLNTPAALDTSPQSLVGQTAHVIDAIDGSGGQIRLDGSIWSARLLDPKDPVQAGDVVTVAAIEGPVAIVWKE
ncbi:NfeD family protein [Corynebacterium tapiri]|uniref:NfeD family protein n=1 Tax=Corynebacterium tapiri TaxID=1448266 RepID=A0A5C4U3B3_9CORY|nr:NfeD family protein [Corynebacterium tapiri]TNL97594.1 NfeD family protein [Corynebacterium tapiri]